MPEIKPIYIYAIGIIAIFALLFSFLGQNLLIPAWQDINLGGATLTRSVNNQPDLININGTNIVTYAFTGSTLTKELHGNFELQHDYLEYSDIYPHAHIYTTTNTNGNITLFLDYWIITGETDNNIITGTLNYTVSTNNKAWEQLVFMFGKIDGNLLKIGSQIHFRIYRNPTLASDTYTGNIALGTIGIHYLIDSFGSKYISRKGD